MVSSVFAQKSKLLESRKTDQKQGEAITDRWLLFCEHLAPVLWALTCDTCKVLGEVFLSLDTLYCAVKRIKHGRRGCDCHWKNRQSL